MFALTAGLFLAGCGGLGADNGVGPGPGPGPGLTGLPTVNLSDSAEVQYVFLSGVGRRSVGSQIAVFDFVRASVDAFVTTTRFVPNADLSTGGWGESPLFSKLNEAAPDDSTYVTYLSGDPSLLLQLQPRTVSNPEAEHVLRVRVSAAGSSRFTVELLQGTMRVGFWQFTCIEEFHTHSLTLSDSQRETITDYSNLRVRVTAESTGDRVSWVSFEIRDSAEMVIPGDHQGSGTLPSVQLDGYTANSYLVTVPTPIFQAPNAYDSLTMGLISLDEIGTGGNRIPLAQNVRLEDLDTALLPVPFALDLTVFRGRQSTVTLRIDNEVLRFDHGTETVQFDRELFKEFNYDLDEQAIVSRLSDFVTFDLTAMPEASRPTMSNGTPATMLHLTGDAIALSTNPRSLQSADPTPNFEVIHPVFVDEGFLVEPQQLGTGIAVGTYSLIEPDPRDILEEGLMITALKGSWRPFTQVLGNLGEFVMVALPNSRDTEVQQVVAFTRNSAGRPTNVHIGVVDYTDGSVLLNPVEILSLLPPENYPANGYAVQGTVSELTRIGGVVRHGRFQLGDPPAGFPSTGLFVVFRK